MDPFKICSKCGYTWKCRDDFLKDPSICLVGFQVNPIETKLGYYLFNHMLDGNHCNTTIAVEVGFFLSMYEGTMFTDIKFKGPQCELHCSSVDDLSRCPAQCKNAMARELMQSFSHC